MPLPPKKTLDEMVNEQAQRYRADRAARRRVDAEEAPPVTYPPVQSLKDLLARNLGAQHFRIEKVLPANARAILAAQYKAGKTTMVGNLMRSLADEDPFLGMFDVLIPASAIVLIDNEMSEHQVQQWLGDQGIVNQRKVADVVCLRGNLGAFNLLDPKCREIWAKRLAALGCDYLILDCLRPCLDALGLDENHETGQFLGAFDALLYEAGIPDACLVHHMGHANERSRGDSRLVDWPDTTLKLVRDGDGPRSPRYFSVLGRDAAVAEGSLSFDRQTRHLVYNHGSRAALELDAAVMEVIKLLAEDFVNGGKGLSMRAIERDVVPLGHTRNKVNEAVKRDLDSGLTSRIGVKTGGPRGAHLHHILHPCSVCGMPVAIGASKHLACGTGAGP